MEETRDEDPKSIKLHMTELLCVSFSVGVIEGKQRLLLSDLQLHLTTQHFCNTTLREMTMTQLSHADTQVHRHPNHGYTGTLTYTLNVHPHLCCSLIGQSLQHELLSDLETASELLRSHAQFLIGHALDHNVRLRLVTSVLSDKTTADDGQKVRQQ